MSQFVIGQRFVSETEPELGLGRVEKVQDRRVFLHFPASDVLRQYATSSAPIKRVCFRVGDEIEDDTGRRFCVETVEEEGGLFSYSGNGARIDETQLAGTLRFSKPEERLLAGLWDSSRSFDLRYRTWKRQYAVRKSPVRGFLGGRVDLIPHQLYIGHEIASRPLPRALLADEVGLGKTIEAGLILHRLLRSGQISRVLILVPEPLVHQWFVEMFRRFHLSFTLIDQDYCQAIALAEPDANPFLQSQTAIVSLEFLADDPDKARLAQQAGWELLVVDEAHHLEWSPEGASAEYALVADVAATTPGLLLLTATPEQLGEEGHFARLRLLDPDRYPSYEGYLNEALHFRPVAEIAGKLLDGGALEAEDARLLSDILPAAATRSREKLARAQRGDAEARESFINDLLDQHGTGRVIFRNSRRVLDQFPGRRVHPVVLEWPRNSAVRYAQHERLAKEFVIDTCETGVRLAEPYEKDERVLWLARLLKESRPEKLLLICRTREKVAAIQEALRKLSPAPVAVFHEELSLLQRDRNAAWFAEKRGGAQALLCSEIGSEGRNFQFANHLVLFDLPLSPELLEQRIGRLDRIGQEKTVEIHVPFLSGSAQESLFRWYQEGLDAFETSLAGGFYFEPLAMELREMALEHIDTSDPGGEGPAELPALLEKTRQRREDIARKLEQGRDRLLELSSFRPGAAESLIEQIREWDSSMALDEYLAEALDSVRIDLDVVGERTYVLRQGSRSKVERLPGTRSSEVAMTASRDKATHQGELDFLTWDHPMVTGLMELILGEEHGNCAVALLPSSGEEELLLEAVFVLDAVAKPSLYADRFLPSTPLRFVVNQELKDVTALWPRERSAHELQDARRRLQLEENNALGELVPKMVQRAHEIAAGMRGPLLKTRLDEMRLRMGGELERLRSLKQLNDHVRDEEIERVAGEMKELETAIAGATMRLDALRLIWKSQAWSADATTRGF